MQSAGDLCGKRLIFNLKVYRSCVFLSTPPCTSKKWDLAVHLAILARLYRKIHLRAKSVKRYETKGNLSQNTNIGSVVVLFVFFLPGVLCCFLVMLSFSFESDDMVGNAMFLSPELVSSRSN